MKFEPAMLCAASVLFLAACSNGNEPLTPTTGPCTDFSRYLHIASSLDLTGDSRRTARAGDFLYVAGGEAGVLVADISSLSQPLAIGTIDTPGTALDAACSGGALYVADGAGGLRIFSIEDPAHPVELSALDTAGPARSVAARDRLVYLTDEVGLRVVDARDPLHPIFMGGDNTPGRAIDLALGEDHVFVSDSVLGLRVIRLGVLSDFSSVAVLALPGEPQGIAIDQDRVYVACGTAGVCTVDARFPARPVLSSREDTPGTARDLSIAGSRLYLGESSGVLVYGLDRSSLHFITRLATRADALGVEAGRGLAVAACGAGGAQIIEAFNPNPPPEVSRVEVAGGAAGVFSVNGALYVCGPAGIAVVDARDPERPLLAATLPLAGGASFLAAREGTAYLCAGNDRAVRALDVTDPFAPLELGTLGVGAERLAARDSILVLARMSGGIQIEHIGNPAAPRFLANQDTGDVAFDVALDSRHAYVANNRSLLVVDLLDPVHPRPIAELSLDGVCRGVFLAGGSALVAAGDAGIHIVDIRNPALPARISQASVAGFASHVIAVGGAAYVSGESGGVQVLDIAELAAPAMLGTFHGSGISLVSAADSFFLYAADRESGLVIARAQCGP